MESPFLSEPQTSHTDVFRKTDRQRPQALRLEALGLHWLGAATAAGGAPVVPVLDQHDGVLTLPRLLHGSPSREAAYQFGQTLAVTHAAGAPSLGCPPPGWEDDGTMGRMELPLRQPGPGRPTRWGEFFADERIAPCLPPARRNGSLSSSECELMTAVLEDLRAGRWDAPQPALVPDGQVARIHGDLWCGNVLWVPRAAITWTPLPASLTADVVGVLIDPAAQGGHAETDLAFLEVFGQDFLAEIYQGYQSVSPLADGWEERRRVHQLYLLAVHTAIFGGSYGAETVHCARQCLGG